MTPQRLRAYVLILIRDVAIPSGGLYLAVSHPPYYLLPLIAGMLGVPLVARGGGDDLEPDSRPSPDPLPSSEE